MAMESMHIIGGHSAKRSQTQSYHLYNQVNPRIMKMSSNSQAAYKLYADLE